MDIGCGFGRHIEIIANFSKEVIGIDINFEMIEKAKNKLSNFKNVKLFIKDAQNLDFKKDYFNYVICFTNTFGVFPEIKERVLREMKRVCKKNGKIILSVYNDNALKIRKENYEKIGLNIVEIKNNVVYTKQSLISEQFSKHELKELFNKVNLKSKILELNSISFLCELKK